MSRAIIGFIIILISGICSITTSAQTHTVANDSVANALRLRNLQAEKQRIEKEIEVEDGKRNVQIAGVSVETLEKINNRQDSICLALRSELVDVVLEIKELSPDAVAPELVQQFNNVLHKKDEIPAKNEDDNATDPSKPAPRKSKK